MYHALEQYETDSYQETQSAEMMYWIGREHAANTAQKEITLAQFMDASSVMPRWIGKAITIQSPLNCKKWCWGT